MKKLLLVLGLLLAPTWAHAQCNGVFPPSTLCGNLGATPALPAPFPSSGSVVGPVSSTVGHFATWANITGTQLADFDLFGTANSFTAAQTFTSVDINGGTVDNTAIGGTTRAAGAFTTLAANGATTLTSTLAVTGNVTVNTTMLTVNATNGNTVVAGTLGSGALSVTGTITSTGAIGAGGAASGAWLQSAAGTTTVAPIKLTSGTNLTTAAAGAIEYDGRAFYATSVASARQAARTEQFQVLAADQTATSGTGAQVWFPGGGPTGVTLQSDTTYFFEGLLSLSNGSTSHTTALAFAGTATLTSIRYFVTTLNAADNTQGSGTHVVVNQAAATVINASSGQPTGAWVTGTVRINAGGTFIPQFQWSANPSGTNLVKANTFFRIWPAGAAAVTTVGNWQ